VQSTGELSHHTYVENVLKYYRDNDIVQGDPNEGVWHQAHYPLPKCLGNQTILLLREHHAVQGVLQSEELQLCCVWGWEKDYLTEDLLEKFHKWRFVARQKGGLKSGPEAKRRGDGIHLHLREWKVAGGKTPAGRLTKYKLLMGRATPILMTREDDGHVFHFDSCTHAADVLSLNRKTLRRHLDKNTSYKGYIITTFEQ
jgi:hypothetical protein